MQKKTRRNFLRSTGVVFTGAAIAGCTGSSTSSEGSTEQDEQEDTGTPRYGSNVSGDTLGWEVDYPGEWSGSLSTDGKQQSIDGYGLLDGNINPAPDYASITAQKRDNGIGTLAVRFYYDGEIVNESSTSAEYGVATVSVNKQS